MRWIQEWEQYSWPGQKACEYMAGWCLRQWRKLRANAQEEEVDKEEDLVQEEGEDKEDAPYIRGGAGGAATTKRKRQDRAIMQGLEKLLASLAEDVDGESAEEDEEEEEEHDEDEEGILEKLTALVEDAKAGRVKNLTRELAKLVSKEDQVTSAPKGAKRRGRSASRDGRRKSSRNRSRNGRGNSVGSNARKNGEGEERTLTWADRARKVANESKGKGKGKGKVEGHLNDKKEEKPMRMSVAAWAKGDITGYAKMCERNWRPEKNLRVRWLCANGRRPWMQKSWRKSMKYAKG